MIDIDEFNAQVEALEDSLGGAQEVALGFNVGLKDMKSAMSETSRQVGDVSNGISRGLRGAFDGLLYDGMKLSDALTRIGKSMVDAALTSAVNPVTQQVGQSLGDGIESLISAVLPFAKGSVFSEGRVMPFAHGGVVSSPTTFPMRGATGLMGEAGPEAIMPLTRGPDGRLGVQGAGRSRPVNVVMNLSTPDVRSFQKSQSQIAAQMSRMLARGQSIR
ncbi:phage tail tape measure protein [Qingshengfaniella alkalisoli]|uniref:Phage tail tape measure protein n=1 Tax=Qingshengfaniella alkalisoli TaxID=2599296 RepID=A0A5B8I8E4_9RHOB|nr:phage tail tape measure protein [Qingshengfaniella alkalisoli]QDY68926.1 phage tail tape measure protein [Qingshengfaniella alkalisoli]